MPTVIIKNFEWDEDKNIKNIAKHWIDFYNAINLFNGIIYEYNRPRYVNDEARWLVIGVLDGEIVSVVYTWRGNRRRLISVRRARKDECRRYIESIPSIKD